MYMTTVGDHDVPASKQSEGFPLLHSTHTKLYNKEGIERQFQYSVDLIQKQLRM